MRVLVITDGLEPSLHGTVVGLAERGHNVRVVGAHSGDELDPITAFRLGGRVRLTIGRGHRSLSRASHTTRLATRVAMTDAGLLRRIVGRARHGGAPLPTAFECVTRAIPLIAEPVDVLYFEAANVAAQHVRVLDLLGPKVLMCTGSDVRILPDFDPWLARALPPVFAAMMHVVCPSHELRHFAVRRGAPPARTVVLYPPVDTKYFHPAGRPRRDDDVLRLVSVGRMHWVKGYEDAMRSVALARAAGHDVMYTIVGADEGAGQALRYAAHDLGLDEVITFAGPRSHAGVRAALARADVFMLSSVSEGASRSALEAMAMGLPVVTTDVGGMREIVDDGVEGFVVPSRDPQSLANAIVSLATSPGRRRELGTRARARAERYDASMHLDRIEELLLDAFERGGAP